MVRVSSPPRSMVMVCPATWTVTTRPAWMRPRAIFCPATMMTPVLLARRCTVTGSADGRGGGPAVPASVTLAGLMIKNSTDMRASEQQQAAEAQRVMEREQSDKRLAQEREQSDKRLAHEQKEQRSR